jgi:hypothetical protein
MSPGSLLLISRAVLGLIVHFAGIHRGDATWVICRELLRLDHVFRRAAITST